MGVGVGWSPVQIFVGLLRHLDYDFRSEYVVSKQFIFILSYRKLKHFSTQNNHRALHFTNLRNNAPFNGIRKIT